MWYNLDHNRLLLDKLPGDLRNLKNVQLLKNFLAALITVHYRWKLFRHDNLYKIEHTGQICYFQKAFNDALDMTERRIYIDSGNSFNRKYLYTTPENRPVFLGVMHLYEPSDYADTGVDFIVFSPAEIIDNHPYELNALIQFYKPGGKRYKIQPIV